MAGVSDANVRYLPVVSFRLAGFPVQISPTFLILALFVIDAGFGAAGLLLWVAAAFLSILLHEMAHAVVARWVGGRVDRIVIYGMGGLTYWSDPRRRVDSRRRILISLAGSAAGLVLGLLLFASVRLGIWGVLAESFITRPWQVDLGSWAYLGMWGTFFVAALIWTNVVWGAINWLPIGGLDGSHVLGELLERFIPGRGRFHAAVIGIIVAVLAAVWLYSVGFTFAPLIFLWFAFNDFQRVQRRS